MAPAPCQCRPCKTVVSLSGWVPNTHRENGIEFPVPYCSLGPALFGIWVMSSKNELSAAQVHEIKRENQLEDQQADILWNTVELFKKYF